MKKAERRRKRKANIERINRCQPKTSTPPDSPSRASMERSGSAIIGHEDIYFGNYRLGRKRILQQLLIEHNLDYRSAIREYFSGKTFYYTPEGFDHSLCINPTLLQTIQIGKNPRDAEYRYRAAAYFEYLREALEPFPGTLYWEEVEVPPDMFWCNETKKTIPENEASPKMYRSDTMVFAHLRYYRRKHAIASWEEER